MLFRNVGPVVIESKTVATESQGRFPVETAPVCVTLFRMSEKTICSWTVERFDQPLHATIRRMVFCGRFLEYQF